MDNTRHRIILTTIPLLARNSSLGVVTRLPAFVCIRELLARNAQHYVPCRSYFRSLSLSLALYGRQSLDPFWLRPSIALRVFDSESQARSHATG